MVMGADSEAVLAGSPVSGLTSSEMSPTAGLHLVQWQTTAAGSGARAASTS